MTAPRPNVWTTSAGLGEVLVEHVLQGFPLPPEERAQFDLSHWTILVPTRRAARMLEQKLFEKAGRKVLVLPRIRPMGDVDEDMLADHASGAGLAPAISGLGQLFLMLQLVDDWAAANPHVRLAEDVSDSRGQALGLARSLVALVNQLETEEVTLAFEQRFEMLELAEHRESILSLLHLVQEQLPARLQARGLMGPAARRNALIAAEARHIASGGHHGPIIAAGSTGTNPATRKLLKAIATHPQGAVILPSLDTTLDDESWNLIAENHPQHAMKLLLADLAVERKEASELSPVSQRVRLLRETMRPAAATDKWFANPALQALSVQNATAGMRLMEAPDRHIEARVIALLLRETLETPGKRAALVTPDRNLGQQVTEELKRWHADIDDSAGEPLIRFGRAQLCALVLACVEDGFAPASIVALLAHPEVSLGQANARHQAALFEISCLRRDLAPRSPREFASVVARVKQETAVDSHSHPALIGLDDAGWDALLNFALKFSAVLSPLLDAAPATLDVLVATLESVLEGLTPDVDEADPYTRSFAAVMQGLRDASPFHPVTSLHRALASITWALQQETIRRLPREDTRLAIYGLAEARMIEADLVVLGGLNESLWPAAVDPGPWFNRPMRLELGLAQPERDIGITAHDFAQNASHPNVVITWSKRLGTTPMTPSRWVLRLRALLETLGVEKQDQLDYQYLLWVSDLDQPAQLINLPIPRPTPPVAHRPTSFSVTTVEKLIRDPYAIYAQNILKLEPLPPLGGEMEPRLRGTLFHAALAQWLQREGDHSLDQLIAAGQSVFKPYMEEPEVKHFWWPRFARMVQAFIEADAVLCSDVAARFVEVKGRHAFAVQGVGHVLTARADRIDVTQGGKVRFIDYKTGSVPSFKQVESGLNPQLTLEAAILLNGAYGPDLPLAVDDLIYIQTGGGAPSVKISRASSAFEAEAVAKHHLGRLKALLAAYQNINQPYVPRAAIFKERDTSDYDHLSRHGEWSLKGSSMGGA